MVADFQGQVLRWGRESHIAFYDIALDVMQLHFLGKDVL